MFKIHMLKHMVITSLTFNRFYSFIPVLYLVIYHRLVSKIIKIIFLVFKKVSLEKR